MWEILNANLIRWGRETDPTQEAAEKALRQFFKGVSGVNFKKFTYREVAVERTPRHYDSMGYCDNPGRGY